MEEFVKWIVIGHACVLVIMVPTTYGIRLITKDDDVNKDDRI